MFALKDYNSVDATNLLSRVFVICCDCDPIKKCKKSCKCSRYKSGKCSAFCKRINDAISGSLEEHGEIFGEELQFIQQFEKMKNDIKHLFMVPN